VTWRVVSDWWDSAAVADSGPRETRAAAGLGARKAVFASLTSWGDGDSVQVELELFDDGGDPLPEPPARRSPWRSSGSSSTP
jgi:hypothetical protein